MDRRGLLGLGAGLAMQPAVARTAPGEVVVDPRRAPGTVGTIAEALAGGATVIRLAPGTFVEKLTIATRGVTVIGSGPASVVSYGAYAGLRKADGSNTGTSGSATITVAAPDVTFRNLTIRNSYDYIGAKRDNAGNGAQAVALLIGREADRCTVEDCALEGYQDTLYIQPRARITGCRIVGGVDFIFGGGAVWFDRCSIVTRFVPNTDSLGYIAAPSTPAAQEFGLVFSHCRIGREPGVPDHSVWLGRPWRAGGNMSLLGQAAFLNCWMDGHIRHEGWTWMGYKGPEGDQRKLTPEEARMFEFGSAGPGAGPVSATRKALDAASAKRFTRANVLGGWR
ncbi:pectinesterase family protein [Sphingomonas sp. LB-2]|uniref:pectinesterase family protein n=1 Tax=Sphingomonas caeni TaxID=2984949 RepID=UPI002232A77E|nr:pectinesterase family protein [Sphingomonas caeni]MCW3848984.1 pectinesterase family protein [Sphingomonas caeni]